jgi:DNA-binding transcriptional LysR family regulator
MNLIVSMKYLVALDEQRHFGRAALACHVTQPALSNALRALENHFNTAIVTRGRSFVGFTAEGQRILASARRVLHEHELLQQDLHSSQDRPQGHLILGAVPTAMPIAARFVAQLQARHPGIQPMLRSMSSAELEAGLESLALDMGLGYAERSERGGAPLQRLAQYNERYFLLRKAATAQPGLLIGPPMTWAEAATQTLCLLGPEMHNRSIIDRAFAAAGVRPLPAIETNSILALALCVVAGQVCSVMPGALVAIVQGHANLQACPLVSPVLEVPVAFMVQQVQRRSKTLEATLLFAQEAAWLQQLAVHTGTD